MSMGDFIKRVYEGYREPMGNYILGIQGICKVPTLLHGSSCSSLRLNL